MNASRITASIALLSALTALPAAAAPVFLPNAGFESGNLSGWSTLGQVTATPSTSVTTYDGKVWTINAAGTTMAQLSSQGASIAAIESALGLTSGSLNLLNTNPNGGNLTNGSALYRSFFANAGDTLSFAWNYVATDYIPYNDPAYAILIGGGAKNVQVLASIHGQGTAVGTSGNSGWVNYNATFGSSANYTLAFVTTNDKDTLLNSVLHIDATAGSCSPNCPSLNKVPEPGMLAIFGLGLAALGVSRRKGRAGERA